MMAGGDGACVLLGVPNKQVDRDDVVMVSAT